MSKNNSVVPQARAALDQFKMEAAREVGVNLKQGYNGDLTSREAGLVGGQMVCPVRTFNFKRNYRWEQQHQREFTYEETLVV